jgi:hypothetical protein
MSVAAQTAYRLRYVLLAVGGLSMLGGSVALLVASGGHGGMLLFLGIFFLTQFLFLAPRQSWPIYLSTQGTPMRRTAIVGAALAAVLTLGTIATVLEAVTIWDSIDQYLNWPIFITVAGLVWTAWVPVFWLLQKKGSDRYGGLVRVVRWLVVGTVLELFVSASVQAFLPDRHSCFCGRGSFVGLVFGVPLLFWAFGPALALVFMYEKVRMARATVHNRCPRCEFDLTGTRAAGLSMCPECGQAV